tara:strand:+ start:683 stop:1537 length:855 start_codon:yes stop_codon:yes gene_type:complete
MSRFRDGLSSFLPSVPGAALSDRERALNLPDSDLTRLLATPDDVMLLFADERTTDKVSGDEGDLAGNWVDAPPFVSRALSDVTWAQGNGTSDCYRAATTSTQELKGGGDYVYRTLLVWNNGTATTAFRFLGNTTSSGSINISAFFYFINGNQLGFLQQFDSKSNSFVVFDLPFSLDDNQIIMPVLSQEDNGDGTQQIRMWLNGEACAVASVTNGTDNGDGSADIMDGTSNGATQFAWLGTLFSDGIDAYGRWLHIARGTTSDAQERALAISILGKIGDPMLPPA